MLDRRSFLVTVMLFAVVFLMFMLVNVTAGVLTRDEENPRLSVSPAALSSQALIGQWEEKEDGGDGAALSLHRPKAVLVVADENGEWAALLKEWCVYQKYRYQVFTYLPDAEEMGDWDTVVLGDVALTAASLPQLRQYALPGKNVLCLRLPAYGEMEGNEELRDYFGVGECVSESLEMPGIQFCEDFFLCGARIYGPGDDYGDRDGDAAQRAPYYLLRPGYLVFAFGLTGDESISYFDNPPLLWRTYTAGANVFAVNTALAEGKTLLGVMTAMLSQSREGYVYPVVNARTVSLVNFPLMSDENDEALYALYSRGVSSLSRDVLWPGIDAILRNYGDSYNYFASAGLSGEGRRSGDGELLGFYRQEIAKRSGVLGLALDGTAERDLIDAARDALSYFSAAMPAYGFSAVYLPGERLTEALAALKEGAGALAPSLIMTEADREAALLSFSEGGALLTRFTSDGFTHESMDDLKMVSLLSALGMDNQAVNMKRVFYPGEEQAHWFSMNTVWASGKTYWADFEAFDSLSLHEMEDRARVFLALNYETERTEEGMTIRVEAPEGKVSLILRLYGSLPEEAEGAQITRLTDTAWLLTRQGGGEIRLCLTPRDQAPAPPESGQEVAAP